jgi:hypothetical protein
MTHKVWTRRAALLALGGATGAGLIGLRPSSVRADAVIQLNWRDLAPGEGGLDWSVLRGIGVVEHGQLSTEFDQEAASKVTTEFNGKTVRLPGFVVPLDFEGTGVTTFILVPFVGACVHVPPPPANQLVLVTTETPFDIEGLFDPVYVTGMFGTSAAETQLAEIGYALSADKIEPYAF